MEYLILILILIAFSIILYFFIKKAVEGNIKQNSELMKEERSRLIEQLEFKKQLINESNQSAKESIKDVIERMRAELDKTKRQLEDSEKERIGQFNTLKTILEEHKNLTGELKVSTDNLKNVLSNNQMRGKYGEEIAENLLRTIGFIKGENYIANESQETNANRPDFTVFLPDKTKVNIDVKFPFKALLKYNETEDKELKEKYHKEFAQDIKQKIKEVCSRDYINPQENTVDFVILFVPNEMIFSFIYDQLPDVWNDAMSKKVILAGPFSFTAILRIIFQSYRNFKYQENIYDIIKLIKVFEQEFEKYNIEIDNLGNKIRQTTEQYEKVSTTRTRKLTGVVEKIKGEAEESKLLNNPLEIEIKKEDS
ncbi:MAG: DNA recombination protein RmuC [Candidatus Pacebacteria bacterium]|nr:DNA recombination protein RmuC [Candidatus Paceibacterota bacterium]